MDTKGIVSKIKKRMDLNAKGIAWKGKINGKALVLNNQKILLEIINKYLSSANYFYGRKLAEKNYFSIRIDFITDNNYFYRYVIKIIFKV